MKSWRFTGTNEPLRLEELPEPSAGPGKVVIDVKAAGICHTDVGILTDPGWMTMLGQVPVTLGHEDAGVISAVGDDAAGDRMIADFEADGVSTVGIVRRKDSMSPLAYCWIDAPTGKRSVAWTRGTLKELLPSEVDMNLVRSAKILHLDGHNTEAAIAAAAEAKKAGVIVNFDAGTIRPGVEKIIESEYFARAWTKEDDLEKALVKLLDEGAKVTGITVGEKGSMAWIDGKIVRCPSFDVGRIVDTTGAGDTFHSAFAVRYLECGDIYESMRFGSAVAGLKCRKLGGRAGLPDRKTVDEFLKNN